VAYTGSGYNDYGWNDYLEDSKKTLVARARFYGSYANDPVRLAALEFAEDYSEARDVSEWQHYAETYPVPPLQAEKLTKFENEDIPIRAYCLEKALRKLMEIAGAPEAMVADFALLMSAHTPNGAEGYARAQEALIDNPTTSITDISTLSKLDRSTIYAQLKKGGLIRPEK